MNRDDPSRTAHDNRFRVLGVRVDAVQIADVIARMREWIERRDACRYIAVTGMHGIMEAHHDPDFKETLNSAGMTVPDGMPLVWLARWKGHSLHRRVYGPELMLNFCEQTSQDGLRHFFYGGTPAITEKLATELCTRFPGMKIAGAYSPPFRALTPAEDREAIAQIEAAAPDILWVGLSTPKQERWMREHCASLGVPVMVGVGAAFDIHSKGKKQAPSWMREHGLEWLFRLQQEPRRLWRRYVVYGSEFLLWVTLDLLKLRRFE